MANFSPYLQIALGVKDLGSISNNILVIVFPEFGEVIWLLLLFWFGFLFFLFFFSPDLLVSDISQPNFLEPHPAILMFNVNLLPQVQLLARPTLPCAQCNRARVTTSKGLFADSPFLTQGHLQRILHNVNSFIVQFQKYFLHFERDFASWIFNLKLQFALNYLIWF